MKQLLSLITPLLFVAPVSALFGNVSAPVGAIEADQSLSVAWETLTDCSFDIIDTESGAIAASISIIYNGNWISTDPYQGSNGSSAWSGVTVEIQSAGVKITGLPPSQYTLQTYTSTPSKNQRVEVGSTYEEIDDPYRFNYLSCFFSVNNPDEGSE